MRDASQFADMRNRGRYAVVSRRQISTKRTNQFHSLPCRVRGVPTPTSARMRRLRLAARECDQPSECCQDLRYNILSCHCKIGGPDRGQYATTNKGREKKFVSSSSFERTPLGPNYRRIDDGCDWSTPSCFAVSASIVPVVLLDCCSLEGFYCQTFLIVVFPPSYDGHIICLSHR